MQPNNSRAITHGRYASRFTRSPVKTEHHIRLTSCTSTINFNYIYAVITGIEAAVRALPPAGPDLKATHASRQRPFVQAGGAGAGDDLERRLPVRHGIAEEPADDARLQDGDGVGVLDAARRLVLVHGGAVGDAEVHERVEGAGAHHADLQRAHGPVAAPAPPVHGVQPGLHRGAARGHGAAHGFFVVAAGGGQRRRGELPVEHVVARDGRRVGVGRVLGEDGAERRQEALGGGDGAEEVVLGGLVGVHAEHHVAAVHEPELRRRVVEPRHLQDVAHAVPVQACAMACMHETMISEEEKGVKD